MSHYWTSADAPEVRQRQIADWLDDLGEFPAAIVAEACQVWRRTQDHRPTPAGIRSRCLELRREAEERNKPKPKLLPPTQPVDWEQRYREAAIARDEWARSHGCKDFGEAMKIGLNAVGRRPIVSDGK